MQKFQYLLRCLKLWARRRGLHCHVGALSTVDYNVILYFLQPRCYWLPDGISVFQLLGFFAGIHLAILAAYVCRRHPNASINTLLSLFFEIFAHWPWPLPVSLLDPPVLCRGPDGCSLMPIMLPCYPPEFCSSSTTESTFSKIKEELRRGYALTKVQLFLMFFIVTFFLPERFLMFPTVTPCWDFIYKFLECVYLSIENWGCNLFAL